MNAAAPPSGLLRPTDTVKLTRSQRMRLIAQVQHARNPHRRGIAGLLLLAASAGLFVLYKSLPLDPWLSPAVMLAAAFTFAFGWLLLALRESLAWLALVAFAAALVFTLSLHGAWNKAPVQEDAPPPARRPGK